MNRENLEKIMAKISAAPHGIAKPRSSSTPLVVAVVALIVAGLSLMVAVAALLGGRSIAPGGGKGIVDRVAQVAQNEPDAELRQRIRKWISENANSQTTTEVRWWESQPWEIGGVPPRSSRAVRLKWRDGSKLCDDVFYIDQGTLQQRRALPGDLDATFPD